MARGIDVAKHAQWRLRMQRFQRSNVSVVEFCEDEAVSTASFYLWRKKLTQPIAGDDADQVGSHFAPVRVVGAPSLVAQLPGGTRLEIPTADSQILQVIIDALARVDAERAGASQC
jgi:hypothetical protein